MADKKMIKLPESELEVMQAIWALHEEGEKYVSAGLIMKRFPALTRLKLTTVLTLITRLQTKGFITTEKLGRSNCYTPIINSADYRKFASGDFVEKVYMTKNEDGEFVYNIKGQYGTRSWSWVEAEPGLIESYCPGGLKTGDVIAVILDDYGRINVVKKLVSLVDKPDPFYIDIRGTYPLVDHGVVFGNVCAKNSTAFSVTTNGGTSVYTQSNSSTPVFLYDVPNKTLTSALWQDIPVSAVRVGDTYTVTDENTRVCVIRNRRRAVEVIIVKY